MLYYTLPTIDSLRVLPGKDDNLLSFYSSNSTDDSTYPGFYYKLNWEINGHNIIQVYQPLGVDIDGQFVPIVLNIKDVIDNYLSITVDNSITSPQQSTSDRIIPVSLTISGCYRTSQDEQVIESVIAINSNNPIYFYNGESFSFWSGKSNSSLVTNYMPHGEDLPENRGTWLGPLKPNIFKNTRSTTSRGSLIKEGSKIDAYEITPDSSRTASAFIIKKNNNTNVLAYDYIGLTIYDKKGRVSRFGRMELSGITSLNMYNGILTIPVGVPELNNLMVVSSSPVTGMFTMQYYVYESGVPRLEISPVQDSYYQIYLGKYYSPGDTNASSSVPLTFKINPICVKKSDTQYEFTNLRDLSILYYSRLGGWWQIPCYGTFNHKGINVKNTLRKSPVISKGIFSSNQHIVTTLSEDSYTIHTNWLNDREILEVEDMLQSPEIYLVSGQKYIPVVISGVKTDINTSNDRQLKSYTFEFEAGYFKNTIK